MGSGARERSEGERSAGAPEQKGGVHSTHWSGHQHSSLASRPSRLHVQALQVKSIPSRLQSHLQQQQQQQQEHHPRSNRLALLSSLLHTTPLHCGPHRRLLAVSSCPATSIFANPTVIAIPHRLRCTLDQDHPARSQTTTLL